MLVLMLIWMTLLVHCVIMCVVMRRGSRHHVPGQMHVRMGSRHRLGENPNH